MVIPAKERKFTSQFALDGAISKVIAGYTILVKPVQNFGYPQLRQSVFRPAGYRRKFKTSPPRGPAHKELASPSLKFGKVFDRAQNLLGERSCVKSRLSSDTGRFAHRKITVIADDMRSSESLTARRRPARNNHNGTSIALAGESDKGAHVKAVRPLDVILAIVLGQITS